MTNIKKFSLIRVPEGVDRNELKRLLEAEYGTDFCEYVVDDDKVAFVTVRLNHTISSLEEVFYIMIDQMRAFTRGYKAGKDSGG